MRVLERDSYISIYLSICMCMIFKKKSICMCMYIFLDALFMEWYFVVVFSL